MKKYFAEFLGTLVLVVFGCGSALNGLGTADSPKSSYLAIAFAFGLVIVALAYSVGNISGCHVNPAVSTAMLITGKMNLKDYIAYFISQCLGAIAGAGILVAIYGKGSGLGVNGYGDASAMNIDFKQAFLVEFILTFVFIFAILGVTSKKKFEGVSGLVIGLTLTLVHILGIPLTGTSVNPARSLGPALIAGGTALKQLPVFIIAPLIAAIAAAVVFILLNSSDDEDLEDDDLEDDDLEDDDYESDEDDEDDSDEEDNEDDSEAEDSEDEE